MPPPYAGPPASAFPRFPHAEPTPYHLMLRTWSYSWWKPVVGVLILLVGGMLVAPLVLMPVLAAGVAVEGGPFLEKFEKAATLQTVDPAALLYLNLTLGALVLITWFIVRVVHQMRPRWLASVMPKIRWRYLFACLGLAVIALVAQLLVGSLLPGQDQTSLGGKLNQFTGATLSIGLIVLITTPLQAAGEEYCFRGYLMQAIGSFWSFSSAPRWLPKWIAIVGTALVFAAAHGAQNFPLFFDRFAFGLIAAWLVTYTGGLEAGIALHVLNNFLAFGLALAVGNLTSTLTVSHVSWWNIVLTVTQSGVYTVLAVLLANKMGLRNTTRPPGDDVQAGLGESVANT
ncbi:MAG: lysostaphin resistance A-like protein [Nocardioidaceae bacterium]